MIILSLGLLFLNSCSSKEEDLSLEYEKYALDNGLDVILHQDTSDPIVAVAIQYHVGSGREKPGKTGFTHLFEHMMFQESENVGQDQFFKKIQGAGGTLNGGTNTDGTVYYEVVPKNAAELVLWMESDRMGYMINTVTQSAFANQQDVVLNEKRQRVDNNPFGHNNYVICKNLYPEGHPYNWQVIGEMEDLFGATVEDVKAFHQEFYLPNNATLVIAGDFEKDEMKTYYDHNISPSVTTLLIVGDVNENDIRQVFNNLADTWERKEVTIPAFSVSEEIPESKIYFVDFPGAKQSVIRIGSIYMPENYFDHYASNVANYKLGGSFNGSLNMILREEKGFTYGARSNFNLNDVYGTFTATSSVRSDATLESVEIFRDEMTRYREGITTEDLEFTKDALLKSNARNYETLWALQGMLRQINTFDLPADYIATEQDILRSMTLEEHEAQCRKYIDPERMYYVIVGDAATQLQPLSNLGFGQPELITVN